MYGLSLDSVTDVKKFHEEQKLNFPLLSDPDGSAATKYGVFAGRFAQRVTFVIDPDGVLRHVEEKVDVSNHGKDLAAILAELSAD